MVNGLQLSVYEGVYYTNNSESLIPVKGFQDNLTEEDSEGIEG